MCSCQTCWLSELRSANHKQHKNNNHSLWCLAGSLLRQDKTEKKFNLIITERLGYWAITRLTELEQLLGAGGYVLRSRDLIVPLGNNTEQSIVTLGTLSTSTAHDLTQYCAMSDVILKIISLDSEYYFLGSDRTAL